MMDESRAVMQDIRPLYIAVLNLMPLKEDTEVQLLRSLSNSPLQIEITFLTTASYIGKNTPASHLNEFYKTLPVRQLNRWNTKKCNIGKNSQRSWIGQRQM